MPSILQSVQPSGIALPDIPDPIGYIRAGKARNTIRAYRSDWSDFETWCRDRELSSRPAASEAIASYLTWLADAGMKAVTIQRRLAAIRMAHDMTQAGNPGHAWVVRETMRGIRRTLGTAPTRAKAPLTAAGLLEMMNACDPATKAGLRDRAVLLTAWLGALRRSELVGLDVRDLRMDTEGIVLSLRRSKTDQEGAGELVGIPYRHGDTCAAQALRAWMEGAGILEGPVFRGVDRHDHIHPKRLDGGSVARILKRAARLAGLDPEIFSGHSPRAGHATQAAKDGVVERAIQRQGRWKSVQTLRMRYIRPGTLFEENSAGLVRLS
jgi:integrase